MTYRCELAQLIALYEAILIKKHQVIGIKIYNDGLIIVKWEDQTSEHGFSMSVLFPNESK